jgi:hypothetical protein
VDLVAGGFPSDFYVTCATVIPVLFLALVVQGGTYETMLRSASHAAHRRPGRSRDDAAAQLLPLVAYLTLAAAILGEAFALIALFNGSEDGRSEGVIILIMTLILVAVAGAGPAWRWIKAQGEIEALEVSRADLSDDDPQAPVSPADSGPRRSPHQ